MKNRLSILPEPLLRFGYGQVSADPKEGLFLFGPTRDAVNPLRIRVGVVGTANGIALYRNWVSRISKLISAPNKNAFSVFFPGFREVFGAEWAADPECTVPISAIDIARGIRLERRAEAVHGTASIFCESIVRMLREEEARPSIWFVVVPDEIYEYGRPNSFVPASERTRSEARMNARLAKKLQREPSLFEGDMAAAEPFLYDLDFHNQLKARLISSRAITQIVRESTLLSGVAAAESKRRMQDEATVAWNLSVSTFYKAGGRPWRLADIRDGVCYVGLVFKRDLTGSSERYACCGAQMFLSNGDGMVFKGRLGPWFSPETKEFHLSGEQARDIAAGVVSAYKTQLGMDPKEIVIHGKTRLNDEEWSGFLSGVPSAVEVVGVRVTRSDEFKLFRPGQMPVLRGTAVQESERVGYLWASGYIADLGTYPGWETPNPLRIEISKGHGDIGKVMSDIFQLTKLNFNSCVYADGLPVTLRFADAVGEILTAAPNLATAPLPFRHYI